MTTTITTLNTTITTDEAKVKENAVHDCRKAKDTAHEDLQDFLKDLGLYHASPNPQAKAARKANDALKAENAAATLANAEENHTTQKTTKTTGMTTTGTKTVDTTITYPFLR